MIIRLIRHATLRVEVAGRVLLVDPMLDDVGARPPVAGVLGGVDAVLVTHPHADHLDEAAIRTLPTSLTLFCQEEDASRLQARGRQGRRERDRVRPGSPRRVVACTG